MQINEKPPKSAGDSSQVETGGKESGRGLYGRRNNVCGE